MNIKLPKNPSDNLTRRGAEFLRGKITLIRGVISGGSFFERLFQKLFKKLYKNNTQKTALNKFSQINKIAQELNKK